MKSAIVTGATGMIGSHVVNLLLEQGVNVTAIIRPMSEKMRNLKSLDINSPVDKVRGKLQIVECSLWELPSLRDKLGWEHDVLFHFGWGYTFGTGRNDAPKQEENIKAAIDAVHLAYEAGCKTFVGAGSQAEFGITESKLSDDLPKDPVTGYGIAKLAACKLTQLECKNLGMKHNWGRILSCYEITIIPWLWERLEICSRVSVCSSLRLSRYGIIYMRKIVLKHLSLLRSLV